MERKADQFSFYKATEYYFLSTVRALFRKKILSGGNGVVRVMLVRDVAIYEKAEGDTMKGVL